MIYAEIRTLVTVNCNILGPKGDHVNPFEAALKVT